MVDNIMIDNKDILVLCELDAVKELEASKLQIKELNVSNSELLDIANDMFRLGSKSHLNSLNPELREELGFELEYMTRKEPQAQRDYKTSKNKYISLGKSFASVSFLFDLVERDFILFDVLLMHELLMDDGSFRKETIYIRQEDGTDLIISADDLASQVENLFNWYNSLKNNEAISKIVLATLFHYYLVAIHPFTDGNGRIARLFLNLILLKDGLFPIVIPNDKRKEYYTSLRLAESKDFTSLINLTVNIEKEKTKEYLKLAYDLSKLEANINCLVLTEDGNTCMIKSLLKFHNFDINNTAIESYDGKDNIASAVFLARKMKEKNSSLKHIIVHRDRDNEQQQQLKNIITKFIKSNGLLSYSTIFITKFYDMESYFINEKHISSIFPQIHIARSKELIVKATSDTSEESKMKLRIAKSETRKYAQFNDPEDRAKQINKLYDSDPETYRYGKSVLFRLEQLITLEIKESEKISLVQHSDFIKINEFKKVYDILNDS